MSDAAAQAAAGVPKKKRAKKATANGDGLPLVSTERLRDMFGENEKVQALRNNNDLLERIIMDRDGTDLRAVVQKIATLVQYSIAQFNSLHDRMQAAKERSNEGTISAFMQQKLPADDSREIDHMFHAVLDNNPNDDKARVAQLAIVFTALTIEIDVRQQLTSPPEHVDRFANHSTHAPTVDEIVEKQEREQRARTNQIDRDALDMFLKHDANRLLTQYRDSIIDLRAYVSACVSAYLSYKPAASVHVAMAYYGYTPGGAAPDQQTK